MRRWLPAFVLALSLLGSGCSELEPAAVRARFDQGTPPAHDIAEMERLTHERINAYRQENGRDPLVRTPELDALARNYSCQMAREQFFAHEEPDGDTISDRAREAEIGFRVIGENLAYTRNIDDPVTFSVQGWQESDGHRRNILDARYEETGIGICEARRNEFYITQVFRKA